MWRAGYKSDCPEEYLRGFAARYWGVPPWEPNLDSDYWIDLALACHNADTEYENHRANKTPTHD